MNTFTSVRTLFLRRPKLGPQGATFRDSTCLNRFLANFPGWSRAEHAARAEALRLEALLAHEEHSRALDFCMQTEQGRPFGVLDYRISGIGQEWSTEARRDMVRRLAQRPSELLEHAYWHQRASRCLRLPRARCCECGRGISYSSTIGWHDDGLVFCTDQDETQDGVRHSPE